MFRLLQHPSPQGPSEASCPIWPVADAPSVLNEVKTWYPLILHFACHSHADAIKLVQRDVRPDTILDHNEHAKRSGQQQVQLVVFNACFSDVHAEKLKDVVDFAIGHPCSRQEDARGIQGTSCIQIATLHRSA
eukprot:768248-Hanusia_phi.AAC.1